MKYLFNFFFIFTLMMSNNIYSQKYKVMYTITYRTDSTKNLASKKNMLLEINKDISKFYSYDFYRKDSIYTESIKLGKEAYKPMFDSNFFIVNDKKNSTITKFYNFPPNSNIYKLTEIKNKFNWKILKETKKIGDYQCQKATLRYKGRDWIAWFTNDISLNFGPYIFDGLPGAILYLEDSKQNYSFEFKSLNKDYTSNDISKGFAAIKVTKKEYVKISLDYYNDPYKEIRNDGGMIENSIGELDKPNINQITKEKQEFIKRNNNPIEISEAVKYPKK